MVPAVLLTINGERIKFGSQANIWSLHLSSNQMSAVGCRRARSCSAIWVDSIAMMLETHSDKPLNEGVCGRIVPGRRVIPDGSTERFQTQHIAGHETASLSTSSKHFAGEASPPLHSHSTEAPMKTTKYNQLILD